MSMLRSPLGAPVRPLARKVTEAGGGGAWRAALPALRTFVTANYNQPNPHNQAAVAATVRLSVGTNSAPAAPDSDLTAIHQVFVSDSALRYFGGGSKVTSSIYRQFPVSTEAASGGNLGGGQNACCWRVGISTTASRIAVRVDGSDAMLPRRRFIVNGKYLSYSEPSAISPGRRWLVLDLGSPGVEKVFQYENDKGNSFLSFAAAPGDTVALMAQKPRVIFLGDSFTEGAGADVAGNGCARVAGDMLGMDDAWLSGVGGTGYVSTSGGAKYALGQRLSDATTTGPWDVIAVAMGINDISLSGVQAAAEACLASLRGSNPRAQIMVVGPWDTAAPAAPSVGYASVKSAIEAAVTARGGTDAGIHFLDAQGVSFTKSDATHPDTAGHKTLGDWLALQIKTALGA